jgi:hypothetical protein
MVDLMLKLRVFRDKAQEIYYLMEDGRNIQRLTLTDDEINAIERMALYVKKQIDSLDA